MHEISDRLELLNICLERADMEYDGDIPDQCYRAISEDVGKIADAGFCRLYLYADDFFSREDVKAYHVSSHGPNGGLPGGSLLRTFSVRSAAM